MPKVDWDNLKADKDTVEGVAKEGAFLSSKENLYCRGLMIPSEKYKENWDRIFGGKDGCGEDFL